MSRNCDKTGLPKYPSTMEELLNITNFCFIQAMDIESINSETVNTYYTAHQFWECSGRSQSAVVRHCKEAVNDSAYLRVPFNSDAAEKHANLDCS